MRKARRAEVPIVGAYGYVLQVDVRFHRCETHVTEPNVGRNKKNRVEPLGWSETVTSLGLPLLFDHV